MFFKEERTGFLEVGFNEDVGEIGACVWVWKFYFLVVGLGRLLVVVLLVAAVIGLDR